MNSFLLETNCVSELVRIQPEPKVIEWFDAADETLLYLSVLTLGEIRERVWPPFPKASGGRASKAGWKLNCKPLFGQNPGYR